MFRGSFSGSVPAGNGHVRGEGGSSRTSRGPGGIPSAPSSFSGGFSGFEDGERLVLPNCVPLLPCVVYKSCYGNEYVSPSH